ncbi:hypothetical protein J6590_026344 [Homalodisca vitripennis]|nr:hypothetical protein J6590_026344 [Homalodisca vitripennis]
MSCPVSNLPFSYSFSAMPIPVTVSAFIIDEIRAVLVSGIAKASTQQMACFYVVTVFRMASLLQHYGITGTEGVKKYRGVRSGDRAGHLISQSSTSYSSYRGLHCHSGLAPSRVETTTTNRHSRRVRSRKDLTSGPKRSRLSILLMLSGRAFHNRHAETVKDLLYKAVL